MIITFRIPPRGFKEYIKTGAKILISILCLWYISTKIQFSQVSQILAGTEMIWIAGSVLSFLISKWISAYRLNFYFNNIQINLSPWSNIKLYWLGMFYNLFLPGSISGDAYKVIQLSKKFNIKYQKTTAAVFLDRLSGLTGLGILLCICWILEFKTKNYSYLVVLGTLAGIMLFYFIVKSRFRDFFESFKPTFLLGIVVQLFQVSAMFCILRSLHIDSNLNAYLLIFLISSVVAVLPFTIGGLGARELVFLWGAQLLDMNSAVSVTASALFYITTVLSALPGLIFIFIDPLAVKSKNIPENTYVSPT
jgi:uncharacterized membrane protein YbhN (UPF0104 family)